MAGRLTSDHLKERSKGTEFRKKRRTLADFFRQAKDGVITGAADNDPAGVVTYTQVGAATRYSLLWLALLCIPMLYAIEEMTSRIAVVTKHGLNAAITKRYGMRFGLLIAFIVSFANIATVAADIGGMSAVLGLLSHMDYRWFLVPVGSILAYILYKGNYAAVSRFLFILTPFFLVYVAASYLSNPNVTQVVNELYRVSGDSDYLLVAIAMLGTTISPYLLFWQATEEVEEHRKVEELKDESRGVLSGMIYTQFIAIAIIIAAGTVLYGSGLVETADQAALALKPAAGPLAFLLFSFGIIISGLLAVPILSATTAYVVADTFHWHEGLDRPFKKAKSFYHVLIVGMLVGVVIAFFNVNPITMLLYTQVLNGFLMPVLIWIVIRMADDSDVVGEHKSSVMIRLFGWLALIVFVVFDSLMLWQWIA